ncbi:MAG: type VI secretion system tube protein Hcp [Burkholderiales bacterium]|nr:MAG: type VI secretion system tube protein Hcp [Burkholderiales bacterium]
MASDYLLEIEGVKGESTDETFKASIDIDSFSWACMNEGTGGRGGGSGSGKANFSDFQFNKWCDSASHDLIKSCATGKHFAKAVLHCRKAGEKPHEFLTVTMEDVFISSFNSSGSSGGGSIPLEAATLNYVKIKYEYKPQDKKGGGSGNLIAGYDRALNKPI